LLTFDDLSKDQRTAVKKIKLWYRMQKDKQVFTLSGVAGSGKSSVIKIATDELNLEENEIRYLAFTGKASLVLKQKGNKNSSTIHKLIYQPYEKFNPKTKKTEVKFKKRDEIDKRIKLLVIDEAAMVSDKIMKDLLDYNRNIILIGDSAQLPAIANSGHIDYFDNPDYNFDTPHRQSLNNPIIKISNKINKGEKIDYGVYKNDKGEIKVMVIPKYEINKKMLLNMDQIIVGKNITKDRINRQIRKLKGFEGDLPVKGDKLICERNNWGKVIHENGDNFPLINGLIGTAMNDVSEDDTSYARTFSLDFRPIGFDNNFKEILVDTQSFIDYESELKFYKRNVDNLNLFNFGYAITCHKSQGSEWDSVLVFNEVLNRKYHKNWLYTAVTRASDKLILAL
jgi:exodeoxyribonuclease-5